MAIVFDSELRLIAERRGKLEEPLHVCFAAGFGLESHEESDGDHVNAPFRRAATPVY